ncbi:penicillin-binding protein activator [Marinobacter sp. X15-166B]|uniref:penicillin-binding protein activator n=1 Tax=Marinobacter sp. X15-166B TaxID=1897620 RepID=UPI0013013331|nr:penicillin-binding protein activator [Marinobacter sp. X15-166B]
MLQRKSLFICLLTSLLMAGGCAQTSLQSQDAATAAAAIQLAAARASSDRLGAQTYLLRTAADYQQQGDHESARQILTSAPLRQPLTELTDQYLLLAMTSAGELNDPAWASRIAQAVDLDQPQNYSDDLRARAVQLQANIYRLARRFLDEAQVLMQLPPESGESAPRTLATHDTIWQALKQVPDSRLDAASRRAIGYTTQGWFELAALLRQPGQTLEAQSQAIRQWQSNWPDHPATAILPSELQLITTLVQERPERIALAVPLSGPLASAGAAIRDGFMAAFYDDLNQTELALEISVHDTHGQPAEALYTALVAAGPDLIVGPLDKDAVAAINRLETLPVPVLALNYLNPPATPRAALYQFGLAAEDEARQIARRLREDNSPQVLALIPKGEWGDRFEAALIEGLATHDGTALKIERFFGTDNLRQVTADLFGINQSRARAVDVERTIGTNVEFEPRRRQDADAIVMVAPPAIGRQFKPLFAYYFGGDLPVYSPSIVYEGHPDPSRDRDLNAVMFTDTPWMLAEENPFRDTATKAFQSIQGQLGRLFALGADAYQLSARLPLLQHIPDSSVAGQTGLLTMSADGSIQRTQLWAQFRNGSPAPLPTTSAEE